MRDAPGTHPVWDDVVYPAQALLAAGACALRAWAMGRERAAWLALAGALLASAVGNVVWSLTFTSIEEMPFPSLADGLWLAQYPLIYVALALLVRHRLGRLQPGMWLDGLVSGLACAALCAALAFDTIVQGTGGSAAVVATTLAYPVADLLLLVLVVGVIGLTGLRPGRAWSMLGGGLLAYAIADTLYLYGTATGTYVEGTWLDALWPLGSALLAASAWQPARRASTRSNDWLATAVPVVCMLLAVGVLVVCAIGNGRTVAVALAAGAMCAVTARTVITFRETRQLVEARRIAVTDELTGLPNRRALLGEIATATAAGHPVALLLIDLDHFKELNDTLGHPLGDALLCAVGPRVHAALRPEDLLARLGGDEFAVLLPTADHAAAREVAQRLLEALEEPFELDGFLAQIEASVGVALAPQHATDAAGLLQRADVAMYCAKRERTGVELYAPDRDRHSRERVAMLGELRVGLERGELELHFQPQIDLATGALHGVEALARWRHPERGLLGPGEFLPAVEQTSLMRPFTDRLIRDALQAAERWQAAGVCVPVAVNVAAPNLLDAGFPERVARQLRASGAAPAQLRVEVTETAVMTDVQRARKVLHGLRDLGVSLALDDFGVGHSSMSNLKALPVDELKIDRSFVAGVVRDRRDAAIVQATIALARALDLSVIAEGVEDVDTWNALAATACDRVQGFLVARPLPADALLAWAQGWTSSPPAWATAPTATPLRALPA